MKRNTPQLWDNVWKDTSSTEEDAFKFIKEENCIRWQRIEKIVLKEFGSFNNLNVIEIGAGVGTNAALMAKKGAKVTIPCQII
jgi:2-polyprenyl-3-methyl-5-hydroxy-6-metoxy-1,4-benzoquinol methylase